ncbi:MAG: DUF99 family protein [Gammaproteobacteria bacterium]|jgi:endonuclease V-like protein UPF0215 family|nr:DUF99 family protein [Gammaproteobacteria bacterium]
MADKIHIDGLKDAPIYGQQVGLCAKQARELVKRYAINGALPEPLRTAPLIAGGIVAGASRHRPERSRARAPQDFH